jgi:outer membrane protein assembly factor BamA
MALAVASQASAAAGPATTDDLYPHRRGRRVVFSIYAPNSTSAQIIGDFNDWDPRVSPLARVGDDIWEIALRLPEGVYEYKFIVDGRRFLDPSNPDEVTAGDGSVRSRIRVLDNGRVAHWQHSPRRNDRVPVHVTLAPVEQSRLSFGGDFSYQRVDGSTFWLKAKYNSGYPFAPEVDVRFGYGWESERTTWEVDFAQPIEPSRSLALGIFYVRGTGYENQAGVGWSENTLSSLLVKHDFRDYYAVRGYAPYVRIRLPGHTTLRLSYAVEDYDSLTTPTNWSIFSAGRDAFRPNPRLWLLTDPDGLGGSGRLQATRVELVIDSRRGRHVGTVGAFVRGFLELGGGEFSYARWVGDLRGYTRLGPPVHLSARVVASGRFGDDVMPSQKLFYIGGLGTVRGHEFRAYWGDHQLLTNLEYTLLFKNLSWGAMFFYDAGTAWDSTREQLGDGPVLQAVGVGLKTADNDFQVNFAKPFGEITGDVVTTVRLQRTF